MTIEQFIAAFEEELQLSPGGIRPGTRLADIPRFDSMGRLGFMAMIDTKLGLVIDADRLEKCQTIADLHRLVVPPTRA